MLKRFVLIASAVSAVALLGAAQAAQAPSLAGTYRCGPDEKACEWSGATFTVTQNGNTLDVKNDKGAEGIVTVTSNISVSAGPPWNMLGTVAADGRTIDWSNGTQWRKQ
jgi:opacity protein-like surface antigen